MPNETDREFSFSDPVNISLQNDERRRDRESDLAEGSCDGIRSQAEVAAHNMLHPAPLRRPHLEVPAFWSSQFGVNIKSVGVPTFSDKVVIAQGSLESRRFVAVYGRARLVR